MIRVRVFSKPAQAIADGGMLTIAYLLAYLVRFEGVVPLASWRTFAWTLPYVIAMHYVALRAAGVSRMVWRYVGLADVRRIALGLAISAGALIASRLVVGAAIHSLPEVTRALIPFGVLFTDVTLSFLGIVGLRVARRTLSEKFESGQRLLSDAPPVRTILIGAGRAGVLVAKEIAARPDLGIVPVGFLDDDPEKTGTTIQGLSIIGTTATLSRCCHERGVDQALITIANTSGKNVRRITDLCNAARIPVKIIPGLFELVSGRFNLSRIRNVAIEDLLGRAPVVLDDDAVGASIQGKTVLVTGAGGSIGAELCRQIGRFSPKALVLVEHSENSLYQIERQLRALFPMLTIRPCIGDIRDAQRMETVFSDHSPTTVFHAAAHKHVPMMEANPGEAVKNNVFGTKTVAELSDRHGVSEFVMISTDKAVNPSSVMGACKRAAEIFLQALSRRSKTRFVAVRFGNVLGSAGSVVPLFQEQIAAGGPVTVTHPDMKRYFMTVPEACQLVLQAGAMGRGGEIFVLDMGEPVRVVDLARDLIALSGLREGEDIEIKFSGIRPGEKLFEELALEDEKAERTRHPKIFIGKIRPRHWDEVAGFLQGLQDAAESASPERVRSALQRFIPEFQQPSLSAPAASPVMDPKSPTPAFLPVASA